MDLGMTVAVGNSVAEAVAFRRFVVFIWDKRHWVQAVCDRPSFVVPFILLLPIT
jgi:hypothetical protein